MNGGADVVALEPRAANATSAGSIRRPLLAASVYYYYLGMELVQGTVQGTVQGMVLVGGTVGRRGMVAPSYYAVRAAGELWDRQEMPNKASTTHQEATGDAQNH
jgi:hypothetical protein